MRKVIDVIGASLLFLFMLPALIVINTVTVLFDYALFLIMLPMNAYIKSYEIVSKINNQDGSNI